MVTCQVCVITQWLSTSPSTQGNQWLVMNGAGLGKYWTVIDWFTGCRNHLIFHLTALCNNNIWVSMYFYQLLIIHITFATWFFVKHMLICFCVWKYDQIKKSINAGDTQSGYMNTHQWDPSRLGVGTPSVPMATTDIPDGWGSADAPNWQLLWWDHFDEIVILFCQCGNFWLMNWTECSLCWLNIHLFLVWFTVIVRFHCHQLPRLYWYFYIRIV